jgi:ribonuclease J
VPFVEEADGLIDELSDVVEVSLTKAARNKVKEVQLIEEDLHDDIAGFVYEKLRRRPMVLPVVVEV